jgi:hypothetical protein
VRYFLETIFINIFGFFRRKQYNPNRFYTRKIRKPVKNAQIDPLDRHMDEIFSTKQKELFLKKINGKKLSKTEREYFSRVVKKKVLAMANSDLHQMSKKLLQ